LRKGTQVLFYFRYVDDIAMVISSSFHDDILDIFNSFHLRQITFNSTKRTTRNKELLLLLNITMK